MEAFKHDYSGECAPTSDFITYKTFSVGIFQWIPKFSGTGLKKSAVKFRISGLVSNPDAVYQEAKRICLEMDDGIFPKTKSIILR